ncbi:MAG: ribonuclease R [Ruminococcaceae bacterium]|nr:ribonuclease R [Oscillospiraceae bacterium]
MKKNRNGKRRQLKAGRLYEKHKAAREMVGKFISTSSGGIFFEEKTDGELAENKYYVDLELTMGAMNGDKVKVKTVGRGRDVRVTEIEERAVKEVIGTFYEDEREEDCFYVEPDDTKLRFAVYVTENKSGVSVKDGDKVAVKITYYPVDALDDAGGEVIAVFGDGCTRSANYSAILHSCGVITKFSKEAEEEAGRYEHSVLTPEGREDLREKLIFTIDGADAKDLDDAISVEKIGENYLLGVHIADVSEYVKEGSELDKAAFERGTSIYFADKVVPMLPVAISNGICSLNSGVDRYALSAMIELDKFGEIQKVTPKKTMIRSKVRGVYSEVNELIEGTEGAEITEKYAVLLPDALENALSLYTLLKRKSERRGALELDSEEGKIVLDEKGEPIEIVKRDRGTAERLIEQFMLCANEAIASWLTEKGCPCVYRIHEIPDREKVADFIKFAHNLKLNPEYVKKESVTPRYFGKILEKARKNGIGYPVSYMLLRTMQKAKYSERKSGHFGLSSECYCHFTSPIRRYPDLSVHRILSYMLECGSASETSKKYAPFASRSAKQSSECELRALEAERSIEELYKTIYLSRHVGEEFDAVISSVTSFGLFCCLENTCEGLVPLALMKNRYWYDEENMTLSCAAKTYALGHKVRVIVKSADISSQKVDFELADEPDSFIYTNKRETGARRSEGSMRRIKHLRSK